MSLADPRPDPAAHLRATLAAFPGKPFAVVGGGLFEDLPGLFKRAGMFARSLYLDQADVEVQKAGPWLVGLDQAPDATEKVLALVDAKPTAVFWSCGGGEAVLWRHLRTLNMARIPAWAADGEPAAPDPTTPDVYEPVMFRHWDARVLGALMPVLDAAQFARVLGPAEEIAFVAEDYGGVRRVLADPAGPPAPAGMLTIRSEQIGSLSRRRMDASRRRIAAYLRDAAPNETVRLSDDDIWNHVGKSEKVGHDLGLSTERAQAKWAYLMLMTQGGIETSPGVRAFLQADNSVPDRQMDIFMRSLVAGRQRLGDP